MLCSEDHGCCVSGWLGRQRMNLREFLLHLQWLLEGETEQQVTELSSLIVAQPGDTEDVPSCCCGSSLPGGLRCSFPSTNPFSSPPGDTQLWPRRVRDHHPLGLCHGSSPALRQHPAGAAPGAAPLVRRPLPRDPVTAAPWKSQQEDGNNTATHVGHSTLPPAPTPVRSVSFSGRCQFCHCRLPDT